jgi:hypothetical protein
MKICKHGHEREDIVLKCITCYNEYRVKKYAVNPDAAKAAAKKYRIENSAKVKAAKAIYRTNNAAKVYEYQKKYRLENIESLKTYKNIWDSNNTLKLQKYFAAHYRKNSDAIKTRVSNWRVQNRAVVSASSRKRQCAKITRTPEWYDHTQCKAIYEEAKKQGLVVDHIVPLQGKLVSGLHWHHNLQLLTHSENCSKYNNFDPETYVHELPIY